MSAFRRLRSGAGRAGTRVESAVLSVGTRLLARRWDLPPAETRRVGVDRDLEVPMPDGVTLLANRYYPLDLDDRPTVLVRAPYGRTLFGFVGRLFAERGLQMVLQSVRGTHGSGGEFEPYRQERADGVATVEWLRERDWFDGRLATTGGSYLGFAQWAMADAVDDDLAAMSTQATGSEFRRSIYPGDAFYLEPSFGLTTMFHGLGRSLLERTLQSVRSDREAGLRHLPLREADEVALGEPVDCWRDWIAHDRPDDDWWDATDFSDAVPEVSAPNLLIGGWYDYDLPQQLADFRALEAAGHDPHLTVGPWAHDDLGLHSTGIRQAIAWFRAQLLGDDSALPEGPVRLYVMGADEWRSLPTWPPADAGSRRYHLQPDGELATATPPDSDPDRYRYDPADPTPSAGGAGFTRDDDADAEAVESRPDVLTYTSRPLDDALEVVGPVSAELFVASDREHTDFYAALCDVAPDGESRNVCDGLRRLFPGRPPADDGRRRVDLELWPTAYRFREGHRIRVRVASGAFPRWSRNPGTGEPLADATELRTADQRVYHDPERPSGMVVPALERPPQE